MGHAFIFGILGNPASVDLGAVEVLVKGMSKKEVKSTKKEEVKFDYKIKGKKSVVTKGVC